jgi:hypothetical protein
MTPQAFDLEKLFGVPLYRLANMEGAGRVVLLLRLALSLFARRFSPPPPCDGLLFFNTTPRSDYRRIFEGVYHACRKRRSLWQPSLHPTVNFSALRLFLARLPDRRAFVALGDGALARWYLYLCWIRCLQVLRMAARLRLTGVVVMADMQLTESALVQWARGRGLPTVTCQHALYMDDGPAVRRDNINTVNYLNVTSEHFLAWGARSQALVQAYGTARCHVTGNPGLDAGARTEPGGYFYVLTDSNLRFQVYNERLLAIACETAALTGWRYFVRYHPDNDPAVYGAHPAASADFPLDNARFAIGHMTSQIYISMRQGVPVYRMASGIANHPVPDALLFSTAAELAAKSVPQAVFDAVAREFIILVGAQAASAGADALDAIFAETS